MVNLKKVDVHFVDIAKGAWINFSLAKLSLMLKIMRTFIHK